MKCPIGVGFRISGFLGRVVLATAGRRTAGRMSKASLPWPRATSPGMDDTRARSEIFNSMRVKSLSWTGASSTDANSWRTKKSVESCLNAARPGASAIRGAEANANLRLSFRAIRESLESHEAPVRIGSRAIQPHSNIRAPKPRHHENPAKPASLSDSCAERDFETPAGIHS